MRGLVLPSVARLVLVVLLALAVVPAGRADPKQVKPDRPAINRLLDAFVPAVVEQKDLKKGWSLVAGPARVVSYKQWLDGNTSVQTYPAKGTTFHGWLVNYSYPRDVGFDILLQPRSEKMGAWSFRAEAQKIGGSWKITTWYPVAEYAPPGTAGRVNGPNDLGPSNGSAAASTSEARLGAWVLAVPLAALLAIGAGVLGFFAVRWRRQRRRVRELERLLASDR